MLVRPDGTITWRYVSQYSGDHPAISVLLAEARRAVA